MTSNEIKALMDKHQDLFDSCDDPLKAIGLMIAREEVEAKR